MLTPIPTDPLARRKIDHRKAFLLVLAGRRHIRRSRRRHPHDKANGHQGQNQHASRHVPNQNAYFTRIGVGHRQAE
jgi:hypothetical protein